jgi:hypothetical protein
VQVVAAVHFYADSDDVSELMEYLGQGGEVSLHPWPLVQNPPIEYSIDQALMARHVMVQSTVHGPPVVLRPDQSTSVTSIRDAARVSVFDELNRSVAGSGLLHDSNRSPVLLWSPGSLSDGKLSLSSIGSQADSMHAVSTDYVRWVNRTMSWVRRHGTVVWGLKQEQIRPDLKLQLGGLVSTIHALPGALNFLEAGGLGVW